MKSKFTDEIKEIFTHSVNWAKLEIEYLKLTAAEKLIVIMSMMVVGGICLLLLLPAILMFLFALAQVFIPLMPVAVAYITVGGILILILALIIILRRPLILNPVARFITRLLLERNNNK